MNNMIKSGKLFLFLGAGLFLIDSIIVSAGLGRFGFEALIFGLAALVLSVAMIVLAFFSKKHIAIDIVFMVLAGIALALIARAVTQYEKTSLRPVALAGGILGYIEAAISAVGVVLAIMYIQKGYAASESHSYRSGGFGRLMYKLGYALGSFFSAIGNAIKGLFTRRSRGSSSYRSHHSWHGGGKLKELLDSNLFRTLFATFLAAGSIVYCAVSLSMHFVWLDILTGIPLALTLATVGNLVLTVKNEYLSDVDEYEGIGKNILVLLLTAIYHIFFALSTLASFFVFDYCAKVGSVSPFLAALNLSFGVIAIAQPFIFNRLEDDDNEWLTVFGFPLFYAALYVVNIGICCLEAYAIKSDEMIVSRIVSGIVCGATLVFGILRIIIGIKNIVVCTGRTVVNKLTPQSVKEQRQIERDFIQRERKEHQPFFKCCKAIRTEFSDAARKFIKTPVDVTIVTNEHESYGSDYGELNVTITVDVGRHLPSKFSPSYKHDILESYHNNLYIYFGDIMPDIKSAVGYTGNVSFELTVK